MKSHETRKVEYFQNWDWKVPIYVRIYPSKHYDGSISQSGTQLLIICDGGSNFLSRETPQTFFWSTRFWSTNCFLLGNIHNCSDLSTFCCMSQVGNKEIGVNHRLYYLLLNGFHATFSRLNRFCGMLFHTAEVQILTNANKTPSTDSGSSSDTWYGTTTSKHPRLF